MELPTSGQTIRIMGNSVQNDSKSNPEADFAYKPSSPKQKADFKLAVSAQELRKIEKFRNLSEDQIEEIRHSLRLYSIIIYQNLKQLSA